jgi:hypothetical protein
VPTLLFKGIVSRDEYFLRVLKIISVLFESALMAFTIFGCLSVEIIKYKLSACFLKYVTSVLILKFLPVTLFRKLLPAFRQPSAIQKIAPIGLLGF